MWNFSTKLGFLVLFASALITAPASTVHAQAFPSFNCDAPGANLQTKIDNAPYGATIFFGGNCDDGPYFIFGKTLNLTGYSSGGTLSASTDSDAVLIIRGAIVELRRLTIDATGANSGISMEGSSVDAEGIIVHDASATGMRIDGSSFAIVIDSEFNDNGEEGVLVIFGSNAFLHQSKMLRNSAGIVVVRNGSVTASDNEISNNENGLLVSQLSSAVIAGNVIEDNTSIGVWIANQYGYVNTLDGVNTIQDNGTDVVCEARGIFESSAQSSTTKTTSIDSDCTVLGTIF